MRVLLITAGIVIAAFVSVRALVSAQEEHVSTSEWFRPAVDLLSPVTENIDLAGKNNVQFKWREVDAIHTRHYEFKLYKGFEMSQATLILAKDIPAGNYSFQLPAADFAVNQVYTWSLRQVYTDGVKNDPASSPFKIIKK